MHCAPTQVEPLYRIPCRTRTALSPSQSGRRPDGHNSVGSVASTHVWLICWIDLKYGAGKRAVDIIAPLPCEPLLTEPESLIVHGERFTWLWSLVAHEP